MRIADVLRRKGDDVVTISPTDTVRDLLRMLAEHRVGALVVSSGSGVVDGIVSERDVVRKLHTDGDLVLDLPITKIMTAAVHTCKPEDSLDDLMSTMTERRIRHVPVLVEGRLSGIVSIGDVVKNRLEDLQSERDHLTAYITG
ncbi:MAG TPA: CBS domain-containing protein [Kineosporiaceae bacterium]|nr:CBS domain-containing protein [Kineosporiaceae bacterium]